MKTEIDNYLKNISMPKPQIKLTSLRFCLQCKQVTIYCSIQEQKDWINRNVTH